MVRMLGWSPSQRRRMRLSLGRGGGACFKVTSGTLSHADILAQSFQEGGGEHEPRGPQRAGTWAGVQWERPP